MKKHSIYLAAAFVAAAGTAQASDPVGFYALVDKVVLEPNADEAARIQIWGLFSRADPKQYDTYGPPERGYMYFSLVPEKEDVCRREWADLQHLAGKRVIVGFGRKWEQSSKGERWVVHGRVRKADEKPESPDPYSLGFGLVRLRPSQYRPVIALLEADKDKK